MLEIPYVKMVPYPFAVVLEQYFDFEHVKHVHPATLGEYVLVESNGRHFVYDQIWPADRKGRRPTSRVQQTFQPPGGIWFEFTRGKHRGVKVRSQLRPHQDGTEVAESYFLPRLPDWGILRRMIAPIVIRQVERIWKEDLSVGVCTGGWPGVPDQPARVEAAEWRKPLSPGVYRVGSVSDYPMGSLQVADTAGGPVLISHTTGGWHAVHPTCPHTGGPLHRGVQENGCVICPWHGARFDINTGQCLAGPTRIPLSVYHVHETDGELVVESPRRGKVATN